MRRRRKFGFMKKFIRHRHVIKSRMRGLTSIPVRFRGRRK